MEDEKPRLPTEDTWKPEQEPLAPPTPTDTGTVSSEENKPAVKARETWSRKIDFLLACIGFSVGLGNVWRFPFLCYRNGGGAFLIPYFISVFFGGIPVFLLEVTLGQFMSEGGIGTWKICPLFQGIGYACAIIVFLLNCEYNIILTWAFYYLFSSFTSVLPWSHCNNDWNTEQCQVDHRKVAASSGNNTANGTETLNNTAINITVAVTNITNGAGRITDPVTEYWERKVLGLSEGVDEPGTIKWDLSLCLLLAWIVVYFCIWKGIRSSGKVMYFTATSPYLLMIILLIRGLTLDGALDGLKFYLVPDFNRLLDPQVWVDAGTQIFFSYSISLGTLTALGSYNKFNHNSYRDSYLFAVVNSLTSLLAGLVIFSILGFMAKRQGVSVAEVAESGINRYMDNLEMMFGFRVTVMVKIMWIFITPVFTMTIFIMGAITYSELSYDRKFIRYEYPKWSIMIGWTLALCSVVFIPIVFVYRLVTQPGTLSKRFSETTKPILKKHQLRIVENLRKVTLIAEPENYTTAQGQREGNVMYMDEKILYSDNKEQEEI